MKKILKKKLFLVLLAFLFLPKNTVEAAFSGVVSYSYSMNESRSSRSSTRGANSFSQSYRINRQGLLLNQALGTYRFGFGYTNTNSWGRTKVASGGDLYDHSQHGSNSFSYTLSTSIIPRTFTPISLSFSRTTSEQDSNLNPNTQGTSALATTITDSYKATWRLVSKRNLPTLNTQFGLVHSLSENNDNKMDQTKKDAQLDLTKGGLRTNYRFNYSFENFIDPSRKEDRETHSLRANYNKRLSRKITLNAGSGFGKSETSANYNLAASLFVRHNRKMDANYSYNLTHTAPDTGDSSTTNRLSSTVRYRVSSKLKTNAAYSFSSSLPSLTTSHTLSSGANYKIMERWSATASSTFNRSKTETSNSFSHNYTAGTNYSKPYKHASLATSYSFSFSGKESTRVPHRLSTKIIGESLSLYPNNFNFWNPEIGTTSPAQVFTFKNAAALLTVGSTSKRVTISSVLLADTTVFSIDLSGGGNPCESFPVTLNPGESCTVHISFSPLEKEEKNIEGSLDITFYLEDIKQENGETTVVPGQPTPTIETTALNFSGGEDKKSSNIMMGTSKAHSFSITLSSRTLKKVSLSWSNRFSRTSSETDGEKEGSESFASSVSISPRIFKSLSLGNSASYSNTLVQGSRSEQLSFNVTFSYTLPYFKNIVISSGYGFVTNLRGDSSENSNNSYNVATSFNKRLSRHLRYSMALSRSYNISPGGGKSAVNRIAPELRYTIGRLTFSLLYNLQESKVEAAQTKNYNINYSLIMKAARRF